MIYWNIFVGSEYIDSAGLSDKYDREQARQILIADGYPHNIVLDEKCSRTAMALAFERAYEQT